MYFTYLLDHAVCSQSTDHIKAANLYFTDEEQTLFIYTLKQYNITRDPW